MYIKKLNNVDRRHAMPRVAVHHKQLTLPKEVSDALYLADEDYLEAEMVEEGVLLKPSPEARRRAALSGIREAQASVRYLGPEPRPSADEEEQQIAKLLAEEKEEALSRLQRP
jgi:bifunctional DNA-binding transcriptional regulator/antitoxin component of YhaV-PrlF toxin-antitoxin module